MENETSMSFFNQKKYFLCILIAVSLLAASCSFSTGKEDAGDIEKAPALSSIEFETMAHDMGAMEQGEIVSYVFWFRNTGENDLYVHSASASCGCTIPSYSKEAVLPGRRGKIEVKFNSRGREGFQRKSIAIRSNTSPERNILMLMAEVKLK